MTERQMPTRIRVSNEKGTPIDTTILDADTGETVQGVYEVVITARRHNLTVDVLATRHWPMEQSDYAVNNPPGYDGETRQDVNVERHTYHIKRLEAESW